MNWIMLIALSLVGSQVHGQPFEPKIENPCTSALADGDVTVDCRGLKPGVGVYIDATRLDTTSSAYLNEKGDISYNLAQYGQSIDYYEKALASDLKTYGPGHPNVATRWNDLGGVWYAKGGV